jgi:hypothetical protein
LDVQDLTVVPGSTATCQVTVANRGTIVEAYSLRVVGELAPYALVEPSTLSLYPETEATAVVTVEVPRGAPLAAGDVPFAVVVEPQEHPNDVVVPEAMAHVQSFGDLTAELTPRTSHGRRTGRHSLAVDNRGNQPVVLSLAGKDPDGALDFRFSPSTLTVEPNSAAFAKVSVRNVERLWRGAARTRQFSVFASLASAAPADGRAARGLFEQQTPVASVDGMTVQDPTLPPWLGKAVLGVAALALGAAALWIFAMRPAIQSTAQEAVEKPLVVIRDSAAKAEKQAVEAKQEAKQAKSSAGEAKEDAKKTKDQVIDNKGDDKGKDDIIEQQRRALEGTPFYQRSVIQANPGKSTTVTVYRVPKGQRLRVTEVFFESTGGTGVLQFRKGSQILHQVEPQTFRNVFDQHYISPVVFEEGQQVRIYLSCAQPILGKTRCENAVSVNGSLAKKLPPPKTTKPALDSPQ